MISICGYVQANFGAKRKIGTEAFYAVEVLPLVLRYRCMTFEIFAQSVKIMQCLATEKTSSPYLFNYSVVVHR